MTSLPSRRQMLFAAVAAGGAGVVAACSSSARTKSGVGSGARSDAPPAGVSGTPTGAAGSAGVVASLADVAVGKAVSVTLPDGKPGIVTRPAQRTVLCFSAVCPHQGCTVAPKGAVLQCPCHESVFDPKTGAPTAGPAPSALSRITVRIDGASIVTA